MNSLFHGRYCWVEIEPVVVKLKTYQLLKSLVIDTYSVVWCRHLHSLTITLPHSPSTIKIGYGRLYIRHTNPHHDVRMVRRPDLLRAQGIRKLVDTTRVIGLQHSVLCLCQKLRAMLFFRLLSR
jgi:hypothetical protein